jgi:hypothetical protein
MFQTAQVDTRVNKTIYIQRMKLQCLRKRRVFRESRLTNFHTAETFFTTEMDRLEYLFNLYGEYQRGAND